MTTLNKVFLAGNLTRDPEVRYTPSGTAVAKLGLAVSDSYTNKAGEKVESTCFVDVDVWARQAETCGFRPQYSGVEIPDVMPARSDWPARIRARFP